MLRLASPSAAQKETCIAAGKAAALQLQAQIRGRRAWGHVKELQKNQAKKAQAHQCATRWNLKKMTKAEAEEYWQKRAESPRVTKERIARIAAQKAKILAETVHSSGVSEKHKKKMRYLFQM